MPLDINLIREDRGKLFLTLGGKPEIVRDSVKKRFKDETIVDRVLEIDSLWRKGKRLPANFSQTRPGHSQNGEERGF